MLESILIGMAETVSHLPSVGLDSDAVKAVTNGREIELSSEMTTTPDRPVRLLDQAGGLVAVGDYDVARGVIKPRVVVYP